MKKYIFLGSIMALMPVLTFAAGEFKTFIDRIFTVIGLIMPLVMSLAVLFFIISLVMFIVKDGEDKAKAKSQMIWGIVILFVMISVWGLVGVLGDAFFESGVTAPTKSNFTDSLVPKS